MKNKIILITGGNDGIGYETARQLALKGAEIVLLCRNEAKAKNASERLQQETGNTKVSYVLMDLLSFASVRAASVVIHERYPRVDVLINNAGATFSQFDLAEDGFEKTLTSNHLSHFLLTGLLMDLLRNSEQARIINVSSHSHYDFHPKVTAPAFIEPKGYFIMRQYAISKLANVMFTLELAERLKEAGIHHVTVNALHPGKVKTQIGAKPSMGRLHRWVWTFLSKQTGVSLEEGASASIYLASAPDVSNQSGLYFSAFTKMNFRRKAVLPMEVSKEASNNITARKFLWDFSEKKCDFRYPKVSYSA
jgi:retinol dehydrogenase 12